MFVTFWFLMHSKNLKDTKDDRERGYKTLTTLFENGRAISITLLIIGFLFMFAVYFLFNLTYKYLTLCSMVFILQVIVINQIIKDKNENAVKLIRLVMLMFMFAVIADKTSNFTIIGFSLFLFLPYLLLLFTNSISAEKYNETNINKVGG